jgi:uncharacterized protein (UPF0335 family)
MDKEFSKIKERILQITNIKDVSKESFFAKIGMTYGNFKGLAKKTPINSDALVKILTIYPDISPEWLVTGKGNMLRGEEPPAQQPEPVKSPTVESINFIDKIAQQAEQIGSLKSENEHKNEQINALQKKMERLKNENTELRDDIREYRIQIAKLQGYPEGPVREAAELMKVLHMDGD